MNTGHVVRLSRTFDPDSVEQAGQEDFTGSWDWLAKPLKRDTVRLYKGTDDQQEIEFIYGKATWQKEIEEDVISVTENDRIRELPETRTIRKAAEWILVPEAAIAVVSDTAAIYYIGQTTPAVDLKTREIDVRSFTNAINVDTWGVGFAGRLVQEGARKGSVYGDRLEADPDIGEQLESAYLSQVGFQHLYRGFSLKAYVAESGYVAAYGDEWVSRDFVPWVVELVEPHLKDSDQTDDEQATLDDATAEPAESDD